MISLTKAPTRAQARWLLLIVLLAGFAARLYAFDSTYVDSDRANVHGIGIEILDKVQQGRIAELPLFSDASSIRLPNGPLVAYLLAIVAAADRGLTMAVIFGLLLNVLVVPLTFIAGRMVISWWGGWFAALIAAGSNWAVYMARGSWHPAYIEMGSVLAFVLLLRGLLRSSNRALVVGIAVSLLVAAGDVKGFAAPAQAMVATFLAGAFQKQLRRGWLVGLALCLVLITGYVLALQSTGQLGLLTNNGLTKIAEVSYGAEERVARDITTFNRDIFGHVSRLASGADYYRIWISPDTSGYSWFALLNNLVSVALAALMLLGAVRIVLSWRVSLVAFIGGWVLLTCGFLAALTIVSPNFRIPPYYALTMSPVPYLLAGLGARTVLTRVRWSHLPVVVLCLLIIGCDSWNFNAAARTALQQQIQEVRFIPLRWARALGAAWRAQCTYMSDSRDWWDVSLMQSSDRIWRGGAHNNQNGSIHEFAPLGGDCIVADPGGVPPAHTDKFVTVLENGSAVTTWRSLPYTTTATMGIHNNLGWSLLEFRATVSGGNLNVRHVWRIDQLPDEPHYLWIFAPFIKLLGPDGGVVAQLDGAISMEGREWRANNIVFSDAVIPLPGKLKPGSYRAIATLFDPNQKKNAVYFADAEPGKPILELSQSIEIKP